MIFTGFLQFMVDIYKRADFFVLFIPEELPQYSIGS